MAGTYGRGLPWSAPGIPYGSPTWNLLRLVRVLGWKHSLNVVED